MMQEGKRTFYEIPTGELAQVYLPEGDNTNGRRLIRKIKDGTRKLTAGEVYMLARVIPSLDVMGTLERAYELEEMRKHGVRWRTPAAQVDELKKKPLDLSKESI